MEVHASKAEMPPVSEVAAEHIIYRIKANTYNLQEQNVFIGKAMQGIDDSERKRLPISVLIPTPNDDTHMEIGYLHWARNGKHFDFW